MKRVLQVWICVLRVSRYVSRLIVIHQTITPIIDPFTNYNRPFTDFLKPDIESICRFEMNNLSFRLETL